MPSFHSSPTFGTDTGWEDTVASHVSQVRTMHLCARKHTHTHGTAVYSCQRFPLKESTFNNHCYYCVSVLSFSLLPQPFLPWLIAEPACRPGERCLVLTTGRWGGSGRSWPGRTNRRGTGSHRAALWTREAQAQPQAQPASLCPARPLRRARGLAALAGMASGGKRAGK